MGWGTVSKFGGGGRSGGKVNYVKLKKNVGTRCHLYDGEPEPQPIIRHHIKEGNNGAGVYVICPDTVAILKRMQEERINQVGKVIDPKAYKMTCPACKKWFEGNGMDKNAASRAINEMAPRLAFKHNVFDFASSANAMLEQGQMVFNEIDTKIDTLVAQGANVKDYDMVITPRDGKTISIEYDVTPISPTRFAPSMDNGKRYDTSIKTQTPEEVKKCMEGGVYWKKKDDKDAAKPAAATAPETAEPAEAAPEDEAPAPEAEAPAEEAQDELAKALSTKIAFGKKEGMTFAEFINTTTKNSAKDYLVWLRNSDQQPGKPTASAAQCLMSDWDKAYELATVKPAAQAEPEPEPEPDTAKAEPEPEPETAKPEKPKAAKPKKEPAAKPAAAKTEAAKPAAVASPAAQGKNEHTATVSKINRFFLESEKYQDPEKIIEEFTKVSKKTVLNEMSIEELKKLAANIGCAL